MEYAKAIVRSIPGARTFAEAFVRFAETVRVALLSVGLPKPSRGEGRFLRRNSGVKVSIEIARGAIVELLGNVIFDSDLGQKGYTRISVGKGATLKVKGDFVIGPDVVVVVSAGGELVIGGKRNSTGSGITGSTRVMAKQRVEIGADSIIAWDVFVTDCDWHRIEGRELSSPTVIGEHVWLAHGTSVLKGSIIGDGCILAAHGLCAGREYPQGTLLGGTPARVLREGVNWSRDRH